MNEQELNTKEANLNRRLAEWAGFTVVWEDKTHNPVAFKIDPEWNHKIWEPNFTQSLDACFKHLVPLVIDKIMAEQGCSSDVAYAVLFKKWLQELELIIPEAALALCLAILKLIEKDIDK